MVILGKIQGRPHRVDILVQDWLFFKAGSWFTCTPGCTTDWIPHMVKYAYSATCCTLRLSCNILGPPFELIRSLDMWNKSFDRFKSASVKIGDQDWVHPCCISYESCDKSHWFQSAWYDQVRDSHTWLIICRRISSFDSVSSSLCSSYSDRVR